METKGKKNWWFLAINGVISILLGLLLLLFDREQIKDLIFFLGIAILAGGAILLLAAIRNLRQDKPAGMLLFESITTLAIGLIIVIFPSFSLHFFLILLGVWAIIIGVVQLAILIHLKKHLANKNLLLFNGLLTIVLGVLLFFDPITAAQLILRILGVFAIVFGILMIYFGFILKTVKTALEGERTGLEKENDTKA
ncbi:MAG: hypothetical protein D4R67_13315 [Bacteroidetes bacterium]|nr:MAG: hypothetical protein D4R67_13315 [Bacteroidota bacterium]